MKNIIPKYTVQDFAIIIPTKDRPQKIKNILNSLAQQTVSGGRIIVVDGGQSVKNIVMRFASDLPVEYYECNPPGQIRQRNMAISKLDGRTPLVTFLDDDIELDPMAFEQMLHFWNGCEPETAGVSFNIINSPRFHHSIIRAFFGMSSPHQGRVLHSGYNVAITPAQRDLRTQWLSGGATVWRREILRSYQHQEISTRWAICEDLIFSYPIGKRFPLHVCADAKVRHEHVFDHKAKMKHLYYGRTATLWRLYFVELHPEMSRVYFLWMLLGQIIARLTFGIFTFRIKHIHYAIGQVMGVIAGLNVLLRGKQLLTLLNE
jgi:glycosyltransferase involved in cell wall biosynthesis